MFYYVKRVDNGQCLIVAEVELPTLTTPYDRFKKYKVLLQNATNPFDAGIIFCEGVQLLFFFIIIYTSKISMRFTRTILFLSL